MGEQKDDNNFKIELVFKSSFVKLDATNGQFLGSLKSASFMHRATQGSHIKKSLDLLLVTHLNFLPCKHS